MRVAFSIRDTQNVSAINPGCVKNVPYAHFDIVATLGKFQEFLSAG